MRYTQSGTPIVAFGVGVDDPENPDDKGVLWVNVSWFGDDAAAQADEYRKGTSVYIEGTVRPPRVYVDKNGEQRASLDVTARKVQPIGMLGRQRDVMDKPPMAGQAGSNLAPDSLDAVPF